MTKWTTPAVLLVAVVVLASPSRWRRGSSLGDGSTWTASAAGDSQRVEGHGDTAEEAMADLANQLRAIRPDPNG